MSVSVCLSVCPHAYLSNHMYKFHRILCMYLYVYNLRLYLLWRHSDVLRISGFVDDVIFCTAWQATRQ